MDDVQSMMNVKSPRPSVPVNVRNKLELSPGYESKESLHSQRREPHKTSIDVT